MIDLIKAQPGITSAEITEKLDLPKSNTVATALWQEMRSGKVVTERIVANNRSVNAYYLPDQIDGDSVERITQKLVNAQNVVPIAKSSSARSSVFDVPGKPRPAAKNRRAKRVVRTDPKAAQPTPAASRVTAQGFACAMASNGQLVLMREGQIQFALSDVEAATLQSYLVKRAAASLFASMA